MSDYRRRRFITDLLFVGGALLAAAGLASTGQAQNQKPTSSPSPKASGTQLPMPGEPVAVPSTPSPSPQNYPPAGAPMPPVNHNSTPHPTTKPKCVKKPG
ncbi:hypothetical protein JST97_08040 [bacterium]|nr:hypothetical protein [bacterium]